MSAECDCERKKIRFLARIALMAITTFIDKVTLVLSHARYVKLHHQRGYAAQFFDLMKLYRTNPTCNIFDYYKYGVFAVPRGAPLYKELLGTGALEAFSRSLNPRNAVTPAWDKMLFAVLCNAYKLRTTEILAIFKPSGLLPDFVKQKLTDISQFKAFLKQEKGPIFVKPAKGSLGQGTFFISAVDENCEQIFNKQGDAISFNEFHSKTIGMTGAKHYNANAGILLQRPVVQHPAITEFTETDTPSGLRVLVINTGGRLYIHRAIWKIIAPGNISDNFSKGKHGNLVSQINLDSGQVSSAVNDYWPNTHYHQQHPVSGLAFSEFVMPLWQQVKEDVLRASSAINSMRAMHWDVIISEEGAVLLELNDIGSTEFLQLHGKGLIDPALKKAIYETGALQEGCSFARLIKHR
jgi:hypothetical protein